MESPCPHFTDDKTDAKDPQGACQRVNGNIPGLLPCSVLVWKEILAETGLRHSPRDVSTTEAAFWRQRLIRVGLPSGSCGLGSAIKPFLEA